MAELFTVDLDVVIVELLCVDIVDVIVDIFCVVYIWLVEIDVEVNSMLSYNKHCAQYADVLLIVSLVIGTALNIVDFWGKY